MNIRQLREIIDHFPDNFDVCVVYEGKDGTVMDDIMSVSQNGDGIQLEAKKWINEVWINEEFHEG